MKTCNIYNQPAAVAHVTQLYKLLGTPAVPIFCDTTDPSQSLIISTCEPLIHSSQYHLKSE